MKSVLLTVLLSLSLWPVYASFTPEDTAKVNVITHNDLEYSLPSIISEMPVKDYEMITGKKMNFFQRLVFKLEQKVLRSRLNNREADYKFNGWGFVLGLLYGPIGLIAAVIFSKSRNFRKSALLGFEIWAAVLFLFILALLATVKKR